MSQKKKLLHNFNPPGSHSAMTITFPGRNALLLSLSITLAAACTSVPPGGDGVWIPGDRKEAMNAMSGTWRLNGEATWKKISEIQRSRMGGEKNQAPEMIQNPGFDFTIRFSREGIWQGLMLQKSAEHAGRGTYSIEDINEGWILFKTTETEKRGRGRRRTEETSMKIRLLGKRKAELWLQPEEETSILILERQPPDAE